MSKRKIRKKPIANLYNKWLYMRSPFYPQETLAKRKEYNIGRRDFDKFVRVFDKIMRNYV